MDYRKLAEEAVKPAYQGMDYDQIASALNTKNITVQREISAGQFATWLAGVGGFSKLHAVQMGNPLFDAAQAALIVAGYPPGEQLHLDHPSVQAQIAAFIAGGIFSQAEADSLYELGQVTISKGEELGLGEVYSGDILIALEGGYAE